ncbi:histidinol-phosphate transaminase [Nocardia wallacei]|uniref:histidinol-phosphate transaminase n=1 Tax=Nocardia wallacei TaxID=480035 RepID=UPI002458126D|nr:histidinol-phosphate transaminase [Nocardia wallacei]
MTARRSPSPCPARQNRKIVSPPGTPLGSGATPRELPIRDSLRNQRSYDAPQLAIPVRLNTNESPFPPAPALIHDIAESIREVAADLHRYPDREAVALRNDLATYLTQRTGLAVHTSNVWAANGSNEVLQHILHVFGGPGRRVLSFAPSYSMYRIIAEGLGSEWMEIQRAEDFSLDMDHAVAMIAEHHPGVVIVTNPHSPTGHRLGTLELERILHAAPGIVVIDEAYGEYSTTPSAIGLINRFPMRVIVTRTLSKAFGFAGGRLGYLVAAPPVIDAMRLARLPYHLSTITQSAARAALRHADQSLTLVSIVTAERSQVSKTLRQLDFEVFDSHANFLLFGRFADAPRAWRRYLDHGVLIRDVGTPHHLRVTIGTPEDNARFLEVSETLRAAGV